MTKYISTDKQSRILNMFCKLLGHKYMVTQQVYIGYKHYGYTKYVCSRCKLSCQDVHDDFPIEVRDLGRWDPLWDVNFINKYGENYKNDRNERFY